MSPIFFDMMWTAGYVFAVYLGKGWRQDALEAENSLCVGPSDVAGRKWNIK